MVSGQRSASADSSILWLCWASGLVAQAQAEVRRIAALKLAQAANVAAGQPAEVPMTDEEIAKPETISFDRLALAGDNVRAKIRSLAAAGTIGTKEGVAAILGEMGVAVPEEKSAKPKKEKVRHG